ncbi:MAG: hypothetical protein WC468_00510 [Candidatus Paceibacterota bacterium]
MIEINRNSKIGEIMSLIGSSYFGLCNDYDKEVAAWVKENCRDFDYRAKRILKKLLKICPRGKEMSPTILVILGLIISKPRRFTGKDDFAYRAVFGLKGRVPEVWEEFLKNSEEVNRYEDWKRLAKDFGYYGHRDYWDLKHYDYVMKMLEKTAGQKN